MQGIGFAIPANMVRVVVASAKGGSAAVKRPWLGAKLQAVTTDIADSMGLKRPAGALVSSVMHGGPAAKAGMKAGDVICTVDGQSVDDVNAFDYRFATQPLGGTAKLGVLREGHEMTMPVALRPRRRRRATRSSFARARRSPASRPPIFRPSWPTNCNCIGAERALLCIDVDNGSYAQQSRFPARRRDHFGQWRAHRQDARS